MAKPMVRLLMAVLTALGVGLVIFSSIWVAGAQPGSGLPRQLFGTTVVARTTVTTTPRGVTTPTQTPTTPTTRNPTGVTRPRTGPTTTTVPPSTTVAPTTTVAAIPGAAPPPVTLPLALTQQSSHVSIVFPILGGLGIVALVGLLAAQWFLTGPGNRNGPTL